MNIDIDKIGGLKTILTVGLTVGGIIWQAAVFVSETKDMNDKVLELTGTVDSLSLEVYVLKLKDDGRLLEYNIIKGSRP